MYKTIWLIIDENDEGTFQSQLTLYHFSKNPKFPSWYMEENHSYTIEMLWNFKLILRLSIFLKCLTHTYIIKSKEE